MSNFNNLFEELLENKTVEVMIPYSESESLRVSLSRRWQQYKDKMDSLGFLDDGLANLSLSREKFVVAQGEIEVVYTRFSLRARAGRKTYQILPPTPNNHEDSK